MGGWAKKYLHSIEKSDTYVLLAEVVELVDTLGSGSSAGNGMGVRVSPSAPNLSQNWRELPSVLAFVFWKPVGSAHQVNTLEPVGHNLLP